MEEHGIPDQVEKYVETWVDKVFGAHVGESLLNALAEDDTEALEDAAAALGNSSFSEGLEREWRRAASYAAKMNEPLPKETVEALASALASGNYPKYNPARTALERVVTVSYDVAGVPYAPMPPDPPQAVWRVWSIFHNMWYLPDAAGYTEDINKSGRFTPGEALTIYSNSARGWNPQETVALPDLMLVPA